MTCNECTYFVEENEEMEWTHKQAVEEQKGFCLIKDLFTSQNPSDKACESFLED